ncbi:hypothetical protein AVEN_28903-1 [Araneus ventricosus]|uniref:Endonuclease/exonuclease/phosphatase domain-containing protein n=1 Tax=Araneus ventricosus TaxID=182803 RepID=A0A4Y2AKV5_ARAVE|nr:hypothetical protein AVEN_28903-1 [Araneus ventricosus]
MQTSPSEKFLQSGKSTNELVLRLGQNEYEDINILISNADSNSKIPQLNPFTLQSFIKDKINRHTSIQNMKFTRQGKIILTTQDPVCAVQLLNLESVVNIKVSTNVIWENTTSRFLLYDISTTVSLRENAEELTRNKGIEIVEMRRFVKQNNSRETSPVLVTKLGTCLPGYMKIWFTNQKIKSFIDRPRQCVKCYSFMHPSRVCEKTPICNSCGEIHSGICLAPQKCINCQGEHSVPVFIFGDFNLHHHLWGSDESSPLSNDFVEWLQNSSFVLLNSSNPTYATHTGSASLLDLSICSASISHGVDCYVSDSNFERDHCPVIITWSKLKHISKKIKTID